jgi:hypothetical protein
MQCMKSSGIRNHILIGIAMMIFLILTQIILPVSAEESISAYCYRDGRSIGSVVIYDVSNAALACNNFYYDCKGKCIGCFNDSDYIDYVCVDTSGRTFLR